MLDSIKHPFYAFMLYVYIFSEMSTFVLSRTIFIACVMLSVAEDANRRHSEPLEELLQYYPGSTRLIQWYHYWFSVMAFAEFRHRRNRRYN